MEHNNQGVIIKILEEIILLITITQILIFKDMIEKTEIIQTFEPIVIEDMTHTGNNQDIKKVLTIQMDTMVIADLKKIIIGILQGLIKEKPVFEYHRQQQQIYPSQSKSSLSSEEQLRVKIDEAIYIVSEQKKMNQVIGIYQAPVHSLPNQWD